MRFRPSFFLFLIISCSLSSTVSSAETALFKSFFEQREVVASVTFDRGSSRLNQVTKDLLEKSLAQIRGSGCQARLIRIEGFSGREGSDENSFRLSLNRAYSVAKFLENKGVPCVVGVNGYGNLRAETQVAHSEQKVEIAAYPKMFLFDFENARYVDAGEVSLHD